jgi:sarcosine oxidase, subunit gamma
MSDPVSALGGLSYSGFAEIREIGPVGMISLRARPDTPDLAKAVKAATGLALPETRRIVTKGDHAIGWMAPDEWLLLMPYDQVPVALKKLDKALAGRHFLAVDVSDARAVFRIEGARAAEVLMKLSPVDHATLAPGELRRTRVAQVASAFWRDGDGYTLVSFRSVAAYVMGLLRHSAQPGSELYPS